MKHWLTGEPPAALLRDVLGKLELSGVVANGI
jgi:hypothetical protein